MRHAAQFETRAPGQADQGPAASMAHSQLAPDIGTARGARLYANGMPDTLEYACTHNAHDPDDLTRHMNHMARNGWELLTVDFAIRGETGFHTFFWQRPLRAAEQGQAASP